MVEAGDSLSFEKPTVSELFKFSGFHPLDSIVFHIIVILIAVFKWRMWSDHRPYCTLQTVNYFGDVGVL